MAQDDSTKPGLRESIKKRYAGSAVESSMVCAKAQMVAAEYKKRR